MRVGERIQPRNKIGKVHPESLDKLENTVLFIGGFWVSNLKKERSLFFFLGQAN
jgi:hypothetical protein